MSFPQLAKKKASDTSSSIYKMKNRLKRKKWETSIDSLRKQSLCWTILPMPALEHQLATNKDQSKNYSQKRLNTVNSFNKQTLLRKSYRRQMSPRIMNRATYPTLIKLSLTHPVVTQQQNASTLTASQAIIPLLNWYRVFVWQARQSNKKTST